MAPRGGWPRSSATQALARPTGVKPAKAAALRLSRWSAPSGRPLWRCRAPQQVWSSGTSISRPRPPQDPHAGLDGPRLGGAGDTAEEKPDAVPRRGSRRSGGRQAGQSLELDGQAMQGRQAWPAADTAPGRQARQTGAAIEASAPDGEGGTGTAGEGREPGGPRDAPPGGGQAPGGRAGLVHQVAEGNQGGASPLAGQAFQAIVQVIEEARRGVQAALGPALDQGNAPTRGLGLLARLPIGGAMGQAEAAANAAVGGLGQMPGDIGWVQGGVWWRG